MSKPPVVPGQTPAFFTGPPVHPRVPEGHAGTQLDPAWTEELAMGFYDQSLGIYQVVSSERADGAVWVPAGDLARVASKANWVEVIEPTGDVWQISVKRLIDNGYGVNRNGKAYIGTPINMWRLINAKAIRNDSSPG